MRIQNNIMAMNTHRQLSINQVNQSKSTEKLSSGYRINRAADDAAGLSISEKMRAQIRGLNRASSNAQDAISLIQAAEGALQESHSILQRIRELAVQGANDVNQKEDRDSIIGEINQLGVELDRIATTTNFNGKYILSGIYDEIEGDDSQAWQDGEAAWRDEIEAATGITAGEQYGPLNIQVGANTLASDVIQIAVKGVGARDLLGVVWEDIDDYSARINPGADPDDLKGFDPSEVSPENEELNDGETVGETGEVFTLGFQALINVIDGLSAEGGQIEDGEPKTGIALVNELRSNLGAVQNRLEHTISNVDTIAENMQAAESRIRDVDMAKEMMAFTKNNILNQAATAMLAQANQVPQTVLSLIR
ncbi:MAG: flagellin [Oscillospiraceae bacterium]|nr:flagellin [Oscillospiraceae bacterium]